MGSGKKASTISYVYSMDVFMGLCRGPVDDIAQVRVGDKKIVGLLCEPNSTNKDQQINKPDLFGGVQKEGGIVGRLRFFFGEIAQTLPDSIKQRIGGLLSDARGVATAYYSGQISANNPYPKEWTFRVRRAIAGWDDDDPWYPDKARIYIGDNCDTCVVAMNPAHIIFEAMTNRAWGRGIPRSAFNEESWIAAANQFCYEGFGLCLKWTRNDGVDELVRSVASHTASAVYVNRETGLWEIRLVRDNYDVGDLNVYNFDNGILQVENDEAGASDASVNEVIVNFSDIRKRSKGQARAQDLAAFQSQGSIRSLTRDYPGIPDFSLAARVAQRDLLAQSGDLRRLRLIFDRTAWNIHPADVFVVNLPSRGITNMVVRVAKIEDRSITDGTIAIDVVQDVFGLPDVAFNEIVPSEWEPPPEDVPTATLMLYEATWYDVSAQLPAADRNEIDPDESVIMGYAAYPGSTAMQYNFETRLYPSETFIDYGIQVFVQTGLLPAIAPDTATVTMLMDDDGFPPAEKVLLDSVARITDPDGFYEELVGVMAYDAETGDLTLKRGAVDTPPRAWPENSIIWFYGDIAMTDRVEYLSGEVVEGRAVARSPSNAADAELAPVASVEMRNRQGRPYPPGDVQINGLPFWIPPSPDDVDFWPLVFTWSGRNRLTQSDQIVGFFEGPTAPEVGTTYTLRIYDNETDTLIRTLDEIDDETVSYDGVGDPETDVLRFELVAVRDGVESYYPVVAVVPTVLNRGMDVSFDDFFDGTD